MALLNSIPGIEQLLQQKVIVERMSYHAISSELGELYPNIARGLSPRSVRRFCNQIGVRRTSRLQANELDRVVSTCVSEVRAS